MTAKFFTIILCIGAAIALQAIYITVIYADNNENPRVNVAEFSLFTTQSQLLQHWQPMLFKKIPMHTQYQLVLDKKAYVVKATSNAAASGLIRKLSVNLNEYPIIHWRWKVNNIINKSDAEHKKGDDYPARIYITFAYEAARVGWLKKLQYKLGRKLFGDIPIAAINYIWETHLPVNTFIDNPYTSLTKMVVIQSGAEHVGEWVAEQRNVYQDYLDAFGEEPPLVNAVAIMTDTDNTGERAIAYYGDIYFSRY